MKDPKNFPRSSESSTVGEAMKDLLEQYKLAGKYKEMKVITSWKSIMGPSIAARTKNIYIQNSTLFVKITSAPLKNELHIGKQRILDLISKEVESGVVTDIHFL